MNKRILIILVILLISIFIIKVKADTKDTINYSIDNSSYEYFVMNQSGTREKIEIFKRKSDGKYAYSISPNKDGSTLTNVSSIKEEHLSHLSINEETWVKVNLAAYFGYGYKDHLDFKWYYVTQNYIHNLVEPNNNRVFIRYSTKEIDHQYDHLTKELDELVNSNFKLPLLNEHSFEINKEYSLEDQNQILINYDIEYDQSKVDLKVNNNQLTIKGLKEGQTKLKFIRKDSQTSSLYLSRYTKDIIVVESIYPLVKEIELEFYQNELPIINETINKETITKEEENISFSLPNTYEEIY